MCVLEVKVPIQKKSGNLINDPCKLKVKKTCFAVLKISFCSCLSSFNCEKTGFNLDYSFKKFLKINACFNLVYTLEIK